MSVTYCTLRPTHSALLSLYTALIRPATFEAIRSHLPLTSVSAAPAPFTQAISATQAAKPLGI